MWLVLTFGSLFRWIPQPNPLKAKPCYFRKKRNSISVSGAVHVACSDVWTSFRWILQPNPLKAKSCFFKKKKNATTSDGPRVSVVVLEASFSLDSATKSVKSSVPTEFSKTLFHYRNLGSWGAPNRAPSRCSFPQEYMGIAALSRCSFRYMAFCGALATLCRALAVPTLKVVAFLNDFNKKIDVFPSPAAPDPPRASKPLLFLRLLIKSRYFFDPRPSPIRPKPQNRYFS